jgi:hypothetical protein
VSGEVFPQGKDESRTFRPLAARIRLVGLYASATATAGSSCTVMRDRCDILDSAYPETGSRQHSDCSLGAWAGGSRFVPARGSDSNMKRCDSPVLGYAGCSGCGLHRCVRRPLEPICLHVLPSGATGNGFSAAEVSNVNEGIVERGIDVSYTPALRQFLLRQLSHIQVIIRAGQPSSPYLTFLELTVT